MSNRVSDIRTWILETAEQRPARKIGQLRHSSSKRLSVSPWRKSAF